MRSSMGLHLTKALDIFITMNGHHRHTHHKNGNSANHSSKNAPSSLLKDMSKVIFYKCWNMGHYADKCLEAQQTGDHVVTRPTK
jgi:hypothetical protein